MSARAFMESVQTMELLQVLYFFVAAYLANMAPVFARPLRDAGGAALLGLGAGLGDAVKSFFKRRIDIAPGASWLGFDQLDFMVGAYAFVSLVFVPPLPATLAILPIVFVASLATTATGYCLGLKEAWI